MATRVPVTLFYSYAHEDEPLRVQLEIHLSLLRRQGLISEWYDRKILPGARWAQEIDEHLERASIILLLVSPDFLASDYCYDIETQRALERHKRGEASVIPIILRPCDWQNAPFKDLQCLPSEGVPITKWDNQDEAFVEITAGIRRAIEEHSDVAVVTPHVPLRSEPTSLHRRIQPSRATSVEQQNRKRLIQRVRNFWIKGVFEQSLHNAALMTLGLQESPATVENPWRLVLQESEHASTPLPNNTRITEIYDDAGGELLVLGEPGAGKTTLLLELARDLLNRAEQEQTHLIPVVFNLSSWARKRQPLAVWLIEELETKYQVPRKIGSDWVNLDQILPLLDGLDEVDAPARPACIQAINEYHQTHNLIPLVVCCRVNEYMSQANRLTLSRAVTIQRLIPAQINEYFARIGEPIASLRVAFQNDLVLQELATTPLMLTILIMAYRGSSIEEIQSGVSAEARRQQIFAMYTQRMLRRRSARSHYRPERTIHELSYLARQMKQQSQTIFYIERMQPTWLMKKRQRQLYYGLIVGPIYGLLIGLDNLNNLSLFLLSWLMTTLAVGLFFGWLIEPYAEKKGTRTITRTWIHIRQRLATASENRIMVGITVGLVVGISTAFSQYWVDYANGPFGSRIAAAISNGLFNSIYMGLSLGLVGRLERRIEPMEALSWSWTGIRRNIIRWWLIGTGTGLILGLIAVLPLIISGQSQWLAVFLPDGLRTGFLFILAIMLVDGVRQGLSKQVLDTQDIVTPNQGIWRSARYGVIVGTITAVIAAVFTGTIDFMSNFWLPLHTGIPPTITAMDSSIVRMMSYLLGFHSTTKQQEFWTLYALFWGLRDGTILGLVAGLYCGGAAYVQHFVLRFLLWCDLRVPFNYPRFLDYATERILLRKVGGGYIFIHRLLLEYFAEKPDSHRPNSYNPHPAVIFGRSLPNLVYIAEIVLTSTLQGSLGRHSRFKLPNVEHMQKQNSLPVLTNIEQCMDEKSQFTKIL